MKIWKCSWGLPLMVLIPVIALEVYGYYDIVESVRSSPTGLLYIAAFESLYAGWMVLQLEFYPKMGGVSRRTQVWWATGLSVGSGLVILLWLMPQLAAALVTLIFIIADFVGFQVARDLTRSLYRHVQN